ncbi:MAG TPA: DegT/DnrJ/EryC1/StrS family aminotransferase, partial [Patescibacteria group bacterium]|nr:DegT/DnrJ/EryC1/StrS family aminotransferase [Patescibacteria group bacterium]
MNRLERFVIKMQFIPYGRQYIDEDDISAVINVLKSDWLTQGATVNEFEQHVAEYHNCKYAVAFCNGTAALHGAYYVSTKLPYGSSRKEATKVEDWEFISTPLTFA